MQPRWLMNRQKTPTVRVRDVMTTHAVTLHPDWTLEEAARVFTNSNISGAPVVNEQGSVVGVLSKSDLIERSPFIPHSPRARVADAMSRSTLMLHANDTAMAAVRLMVSERIHRVVVLGPGDKPVGIVSTLDILDALVRGDPLQWGDAAYEAREERHGEPAPAVQLAGPEW